MKYEKKNVKKKMSNMTHKHQPRKIYNMKYEKKKAFCDFVNMKYEKFNGKKTLLFRFFFLANMKYEKNFILA